MRPNSSRESLSNRSSSKRCGSPVTGSCRLGLTVTAVTVLLALLPSPASSAGSLSSSGLASQAISIPKDRDGDPDYCFITKQHTACNIKTRVNDRLQATVNDIYYLAL